MFSLKLWGGRFTKETADEVAEFNNSLVFDSRLYKQDIRGSIAHAKMLGRQLIITPQEAETLVSALSIMGEEIGQGKLAFDPEAEDIHSFIEAALVERVGDVGRKLHTARSRNDQVATTFRLFIKDETEGLGDLLLCLIGTLAERAEASTEVIMPGYTHLQRAQPVTLAHHLLAYCQMLKRDYSRLRDCYRRLDVCPLGAGALAGTTFPVDRYFVARELGFAEVSANSLDSVSDRDFVAEVTFNMSLLMMHLSRFSEELILWSSSEFGFVEMDDAYTTGSSIMPQKKNPDVTELVRGKTGRVYGDLMGFLTVMKGLPLAYNKDMQEDKEAVFDALDTTRQCICLFIPLIKTMKVKEERMLEAAGGDFTNATDLADYLVRQGVSFRQAHGIVGQVVLQCIEKGIKLEEMSIEEYKTFSSAFDCDLYDFLDVRTCVDRRRLPGGPAPFAVRQALDDLHRWLEEMKVMVWGKA
jgi:argininosuccinate lyase